MNQAPGLKERAYNRKDKGRQSGEPFANKPSLLDTRSGKKEQRGDEARRKGSFLSANTSPEKGEGKGPTNSRFATDGTSGIFC